VSKCRGMDTDLEMLRDAGRQVSSHAASRSFSEATPLGQCGMVIGGTVFEMGMLNTLHDGVGLATESEEPPLFVKGWLLQSSSLRYFLTLLCYAFPVDHFPPSVCPAILRRRYPWGLLLMFFPSMPLFV
jgi:hypothetical protein